MRGTPTAAWAKLETDSSGQVVAWHPLPDHCLDVAACFQALLEHSLVQRRLAHLGGRHTLDPRHAARLAFLAGLHDLGKLNHGFQNRAWLGRAPTAGHVGEGLSLLNPNYPELARLAHTIDFERVVLWTGNDESALWLLAASLAHHGRPISPLDQPVHKSLWEPRAGREPFADLAALAERLTAALPVAFEKGGPPLSPATEFAHAFCGLVTLADWLASDTRLFPFSEREGDRFAFARQRACAVVAEMGFDAALARDALGLGRPGFSRISEHPPRPAQQAVLELPLEPGPGLTVLEAETGTGKTEAALARYLLLFHAGLVDGLYFALPTRTAATQIYARVCAAVARAFPDQATRPPVVLAVPGYLEVDGHEGRRLAPFEVLWPDDPSERMRQRAWAAESSKRYLVGAVVVGTIDQVLFAGLAAPHAHMRAVALLRHLLVVDEVHASDAYMNRLLEAVLDRHLAAGGHALLMSATLGSCARSRFLAPGSGSQALKLEDACRDPYPAICHRVGSGAAAPRKIESRGEKSIEVELAPLAEEPQSVARRAVEAAWRGAKVLVLRNTVRDCLATQLALEVLAHQEGRTELLFRCHGVVTPHHARYAREDRGSLDLAIEESFGKASAACGVIAVATQTVQQSLDLDADLMLTDLCPVDVMLQRFGRLHRHDRARPSAFERASAVVLTPAERDLGQLIVKDGKVHGAHGFGLVYEDLRVLEATWRLLEKHPKIAIPRMNRELVERATHPEALQAIVAELGDKWPAHQSSVLGVELAKKGQAGLNLMRWHAYFDDSDVRFPEGSLGKRVQTRLGEGDRLARFGAPFESPFGNRVSLLTLAAWLARDAPVDTEPTAVAASDGGVAFDFGAKRFTYDRLGLRPAEEAKNPNEEDLADA